MLTCKDASHLISENQERPLGFRERWGLKMHLWMCVSCRRFERQMTLMRQALRMLGKRAEVDASADGDSSGFPPEARERIRKALAERGDQKHDH
ncbi:MAG: zf-HC2 domain-containing protein [Pseudomonadota bacterium]|nr:zf-HC2 domain-containing protein [Pseudomonadota bacterium]MDP2352670.1 zf-HC2 domain-containing protein [Pseudomonadota bacterium]